MCLAQGHNAVTPVRLKPTALWPRVKHSTTEPLRSRMLRCHPWARHVYPSLVLVQPRKTRPCSTERLLMGHKESNQSVNKQNSMYSVFRIRPCGTIFSNVDFSRCRLSASNVKFPQIYVRAVFYGSPGGTFLLITYHLLLTTYYLSLITYYLLLTTYHLLLTTYYLSYHRAA